MIPNTIKNMRHLQSPFTLPKHPDLLRKLNDLSIAIKLHHNPKLGVDEELLEKAKSNHPVPTWDNVIDILRDCYNAINEQRENPRKY